MQHRLRKPDIADHHVRLDARAVAELDPGGAAPGRDDPVDLARGLIRNAELAARGYERVGDRLAAADGDRRRLERQRQREAVDQTLETRHVVGKAARRRRARAHEQDLQLGTLEEVLRQLPQRHELVDGFDPAAGYVEQFLQGVGSTPRRRHVEPVAAKRLLPMPFVRLEQLEIRVGVAGGEARVLRVRSLDILL
jgi:hypothetical protein